MENGRFVDSVIAWLGVVMAACLLVPCAEAKSTAAASSGNWTDAIWNNGTPAAGDYVSINGGVSVTVAVSTVALNGFTNNGTLTFAGWSTVLTSTVVRVAGTITHRPQSATATNASGVWVPDNRVYLVCSNLTVVSGGKIDVGNGGYTGAVTAPGRGPGGGIGGTAANYWGGGGSYGGVGYAGGPGGASIPSPNPYGSTAAPEDPGSAGGGSAYPSAGSGGNGGGAVKIVASGAVTVDGTIAASGQSKVGNNAYGGGSGGAVFITCTTLRGTGRITAVGGTGGGYGGGGAGGRIAVVVAGPAQDAVPRQARVFSAAGGAPGSGPGAVGTLYVSTGSIMLDANSRLVVTNNTFDLRFPATFSCDGTMILTNWGRVSIVAAPTNGSTAYGSLVSLSQDLIVATNSTLTLSSNPTNGGSVQIRARDLIVARGGLISANSGGYKSGYGPGRGWVGSAGDGPSGGSYGGKGGQGSGGHYGYGTYGSSNAPVNPGSPGGPWAGPTPPAAPGGSGGGLVWVQASRTVRIDGRMTADGAISPGALHGAGAGGGIYLTTKSLAGGGLITAKGGNGNSFAGSGGGGRIAVWYQNMSNWSGSLSYGAGSVDGGNGGSGNGSVGTIVLNLVLPPRGTTITLR